MKRWIATLAAGGLLGAAACGGNAEEAATEGGADTGTAADAGASGGLETHPPGGPTADTAGIGAGAMGGDTAIPPAAGH